MLRKRKTYGTRTRSRSTRIKRTKDIPAPVANFRKLSNNTINARPQFTRATLYYMENNISINPGAGTAGVYVFAANGLFDPNISAVGHQPAGFDQYMALYNQYVVLGSTIKVSFSNTDPNVQQVVGIFVEDLSTTTGDIRRYVESGNGVWTVTSIGGSSSGMAPTVLKHKLDLQKYHHQNIYTEDNYAGTSSGNPADTQYFHIVGCAADGSTDSASISLNVEIRFDVIFRDPYLADLS